MAGLAKLKKYELKLVAEEIGLVVAEGMKKSEIKRLIEESDVFKNDNEVVKDAVDRVIGNRNQKSDQDSEIELERLRLERTKIELQLAQLRANENSTQTSVNVECKTEPKKSLDSLLKSEYCVLNHRAKLRIGVSFFTSLERALGTKKVPEKFKAEILLNLLGERASNILTYIAEKVLNNYEENKSIVLREFEPTAQAVLENFRNASRHNETRVQFASRLMTSFEYYLKLRGVTDFETLKQLIVSDKLFQTLDKETPTCINIRQNQQWFKPLELGKECDLYFASKGKTINETRREQNYSNKFKPASKVFFNEMKNRNCDLCLKSENHPLYACPQFKILSVLERVEVVQNKNACFKCLSLNCSVKKCSYRNCFCGKAHNKLIHFSRETKNVSSSNVKTAEVRENFGSRFGFPQ
ncbi:uncharacterized protein LOC129959673 [Argiope bruennichi]|uniref:uncharacterized protein LOC129959673 n=1 Tax=Argiope bruennichi TaxID=94029 RepID=UPI002494B9E4|nr:uncharacterized protein LOC129959673 [Argiope bruennichi]